MVNKVKVGRKATKAPCRNICPAGTDVSRYIRLIGEGKFDGALAVLRQTNPFPVICGYVCPHPCERDCQMAGMGGAVAVHALERFVGERGLKQGLHIPQHIRLTGKRVAIVGSGPAGLSAAYYLAFPGHTVTIFEAFPEPGGMLRVGVPRFRLPRDVLNKQIEEIKKLGVEIKTNTKVESLNELLKQGYDAVLLAVGAYRSKKLPLPGADLEGVLAGLSMLIDVNLGRNVRLGKRVVVLGGGSVAFDCARTARRLGASDVHIACLEPRDKMLAAPEDIVQGEEEGVIIHPSQTFTRILGADGHVTGVECLDVRSFDFDAKGRVRIDAITGSEHVLPADTVIFAIGQESELGFISGVSSVKTTKRRTLKVNAVTLATGEKGVFACGDVVTGPATVAAAISSGRKAALSIDKYLGGRGVIEPLPPEETRTEPELPIVERIAVPLLPVAERLHSFNEVESTINEKMAIDEARRCMWCGLPIIINAEKCTGCKLCALYCSLVWTEESNPLQARLKVENPVSGPPGISFTDKCTSCGLCTRVCGYGALTRRRK